jgi:hypothetical protein
MEPIKITFALKIAIWGITLFGLSREDYDDNISAGGITIFKSYDNFIQNPTNKTKTYDGFDYLNLRIPRLTVFRMFSTRSNSYGIGFEIFNFMWPTTSKHIPVQEEIYKYKYVFNLSDIFQTKNDEKKK